jgi:hypothetical protein
MLAKQGWKGHGSTHHNARHHAPHLQQQQQRMFAQQGRHRDGCAHLNARHHAPDLQQWTAAIFVSGSIGSSKQSVYLR